MNNLFQGLEEKEFYVWLNPENLMVKNNVGLVGSLFSMQQELSNSNLLFIPNTDFKGPVSPFQNNITNYLRAEYNLENNRAANYQKYPSRLNAIFLLKSIKDAKKYKEQNPEHVKGRILKRCITNGSYLYSEHDASWIDFLRLDHSINDQTIGDVCEEYWLGNFSNTNTLISCGKKCNLESIIEVLFYGALTFPDKSLLIEDCLSKH